MKKEIKTEEAPKAIGPYSQGISINGTIYTSGQIPICPETGLLVDGIEAQTIQALNNCLKIIEEENGNINNIVKCNIYMTNLDDFDIVNKAYKDFFKGTIYPARSLVQVSRLPKSAQIEIEMIAIL